MEKTSDKRQAARSHVKLRVDLKPLSQSEVQDIIEGQGFPELSYSSLALARPRHGMVPSKVRDLSVSGAQVETMLPVQAGESTAIDLHLPQDRVVVKALAEVVWCRPAKGGGEGHSAGLRFAAMEEESLRRLRGFLQTVPLAI